MNKVLILGGYGNFGKRIAHALVRSGVPVIIAGRNQQKAEALAMALGSLAKPEMVDAENNLAATLERLKPRVVVNTCGPFQLKNYDVAEVCIRAGIHYIDLADGREFVTGITTLDEKAKVSGVTVISGASTVPGLSSAVLEHYRGEFSNIDSLIYGISPGQKAERGLATTQGILTYIGKALKPVMGDTKPRYGWQNAYQQPYPELGKRWMANCDIPDLDLLPAHYGIKNIRFSAGMENTFLHVGIWCMSWLVRFGLPLHLEKHAPFLLRVSYWFDHFGTADGGMHVIMSGIGKNGQPHKRTWFIVARDGDGPQIPCVPAIILARKLATDQSLASGAKPCVGMVTLGEYLEELKPFSIRTYEV